QGGGVGAALLDDLLAEAARRGITTVLLEVAVDNEPAQRLYERRGFRTIGVRRGYYQPSNTDALGMERESGLDRPGRWCWASRRPATRPASAWCAAPPCSATRSRPAWTSTPSSAAWCPRWPAAPTWTRWPAPCGRRSTTRGYGCPMWTPWR